MESPLPGQIGGDPHSGSQKRGGERRHGELGLAF